MSKQPLLAVRVSDLSAFIKFSVENIGFVVVDHLPYADTAHVLDVDGDLLLLAGPGVEDIKRSYDTIQFVFKPGETISFWEEDLERRRTSLEEKGISGIRSEEGFLGDHTLSVLGPDNYTFAFVKRAPREPESMLAAYENAPAELKMVLAGLSEADLDLALAPGQWSMRQIIHHLAENETLFLMQMKTALAQSGSVYIRNIYDQEMWPESLDYAGRPIEPSVALMKAVHNHIVQLLQHVPDYWERYVMVKAIDATDEGQKDTVGHMLEAMAQHMWVHNAEIREIRRVHEL